MASKNRIRLNICGTDYMITSDEPEAYVRELGNELDRTMRSMMNNDSRVSTTMAAVLTAITLADEARKATASADNLRSQIKDYLTDNARARSEAEEARREADRLRRELDELRKRNASGYPNNNSGYQNGNR
ncbi:Cell division protein ZapA [bioreactor metagenome]|uniref:Cell division protein ZapA n=1 Tax=bioreactor metagenome TaxID=1076179 RepID=A0A645GZM9_9ZZZZ